MLEAIEFARHNHMESIDLPVFGDNHAAIGHYRSLGFEEAGRRDDRFRVSARLVDHNTMTLRIKGKAMDRQRPT
jgi:ribosomal protein S18 acetylase RimI-like enzyme